MLKNFKAQKIIKNATAGIAHRDTLVLADQNKKIHGFYNGTQASEVGRLLDDSTKLSKAGGR